MANDEIKPIEEIANGNPEKVETEPSSQSPTPPKPPVEPPAAPEVKAPPQAPPPPPDGSVGKKAIIRRPRSPLLTIIVWVLVVILALAAVFYFFFYRVTFEINPDPRPDRILLDQREIDPGVYKVMPGFHTIIAEKNGYISYIQSRNFRMAETVKLSFKFEKEKTPTLNIPGSRYPIISSDGKLLFYLDQNSSISAVNLTDNKAVADKLTNGVYPTAKIIKISKDNSFALVLDNEAIKIVDFSKTDLVNQVEAKLPPLASAIHSIAWNNSESSYFAKANSHLIYDLLSSYGWDVYLANRDHSEANMIMQFDQGFTNPMFDWGESPDKVLIAGGQLGILSIPLRQYARVESDKNFVFASWGPNAKYAVALDSDGIAYQVGQDLKVQALPFKVSNKLIAFSDENTLAAVSDGRPIKYNLSTKSLDYFAEITGLKSASSFTANADNFYYSNKTGLFSGEFVKADYK